MNSDQHLRGWDVLKKITKECNLKKPDLITGTNLRKYLATTVQVMDLAEQVI